MLNPEVTRYYVSFLLRMVAREQQLAGIPASVLLDRFETAVRGLLEKRENLSADQFDMQVEHLIAARRLIEGAAGNSGLDLVAEAISQSGEDAVADLMIANAEGATSKPAVVAAASPSTPIAEPAAVAPSREEKRLVAAVLAGAVVLAILAGMLGGWLSQPRASAEAQVLCPSRLCFVSDWLDVPQTGRNVIAVEHGLGQRPTLVQVWFAERREAGSAVLVVPGPDSSPRAIEADDRKVFIAVQPDGPALRAFDPVKGTVETYAKGFMRVTAVR